MSWRSELSGDLRERLSRARRVVAFTGAGVSKESGLDTFRDVGGVWQQVRPEEMATPQAFDRRPRQVWQWYAERWRRASGVVPNPGHHTLAAWEGRFAEFTLVTQNVDGLHQQAGSRHVLELHGTLAWARCQRCGRRWEMGEAVAQSPEEPPVCPCGGLFRPAVVWFGEPLPEETLELATEAARRSDLFLTLGTSGTVYPAAGLIELAHDSGACVVEINPEPTPFSRLAHLRLAAPSGEALPWLSAQLFPE